MRASVRIALSGLVLGACSVDTAPSGLRATPAGDGPLVVFDVEARPIPDVPGPNDIATVADPTSRTGVRVNASMVAATRMERAAREQLDEMEGWGTFAPVSVRFHRDAHTAPTDPAIDLDDVHTRMNDGWDLTNDPVYLVNLTTGVPVLLDAGSGNFPATVIDNTSYFPNDPRLSAQNLVFETAEEGAGLTQADYRPSLDTDFDGVLDHPNTLGQAAHVDGVDNLMTWYERETDTLLLQPVLPLDEKTEYAVVLTDRLHAPDGAAVRSPFPSVHHPQQAAAIARLRDVLSDATRGNYYGDVAGTGLDRVAFAWSFTTQPVQEDMLLLRDGLYGRGPFARFATQFPPSTLQVDPAVGKDVDPSRGPTGWQNLPECTGLVKTPFVVRWADAKATLGQFIGQLFPFPKAQLDEFLATLEDVDYLVLGTFDSPYLLGDPQSPDPDLHFAVNFVSGDGDVRHTPVPFAITVPKTTAAHKPPFPLAYWRHGTGIHEIEALAHAGLYARQGIALASFDAPGHGLVLNGGQIFFLQALLNSGCLGPLAPAMTRSRAIDLNGDGVPDSGGLVWSAHLFHTRDTMRQSVLDGLQLTRLLQTFDGQQKSGQDYDGDGDPTNDLAGDFNGDGVVDVGGPGAKFYSSGGSFGGLVAQVHGALDPAMVANAPVSGGGGFVNIAVRSNLTPAPVLEQIIGPLVVAVPASARPSGSSGPITQCTGAQMSVRWVVDDLLDSKEVEIACLGPGELAGGMTVIVGNESTGEKRCARTGFDGSFRVPLPTSVGDAVEIDVLGAADAVDSYKTCNATAGVAVVRAITSWEQAATSFGPVADAADTCEGTSGCQQFRAVFYPVGSALVAPQEGLGLYRQSPEFRQLMNLSQAALDPSDPINFAKLYAVAPPLDPAGDRMPARPLLDVHTVGDFLVPTATGMAFSRAAGALPFLAPQAADAMPEYADWATPDELWAAWGSRTPDQVMIDTFEMEGVARLGRQPLTAGCGVNYVSPTTMACPSPPPDDAATCKQVLADGDYLGEAMMTIGRDHAAPPLRLARVAGMHTGSHAGLAAAWAPRVAGAPFRADDQAWQGAAPLVGMVNAYLQPLGDHDWSFGDPCQAWDGTTYMDDLLVRFFATNGQDLYYLTHPSSHECLASKTCPFMKE